MKNFKLFFESKSNKLLTIKTQKPMKNLRLLLGLVSFLILSISVDAQTWSPTAPNLMSTDATRLSVGSSAINPGVHVQFPNQFVFRCGSGYSIIGKNYKIQAGEWRRALTTGNNRSSAIAFSQGGHINFYTQNNINNGTFADFWKVSMRIHQNGKVGIGTGFPMVGDYKLYVGTGILTEKVKVASVGTADWADYVFEADYDLNTIEEVAAFVEANNHLPNVPSAKEVEANGVEMVKMDATLLRQVEELWLHTIELNKANKEVAIANEKLENENATLKETNEVLTQNFESLLQRVEALESGILTIKK